MKELLKYFIILSFALGSFSCIRVKWNSVNGRIKETDKFWHYPTYSTTYTKNGVKLAVDTVENYVVSKTWYKYSIGCFHHKVIKETTITYNKKHQRIKKTVYQNGITKTTEYSTNE